MDLAIGLGLLILLLILGLPVAFSLILAGSVGVILTGSLDLYISSLGTIPYSSLASYELITIPLFLLMAEFMVVSGVAGSMFRAITVWTSGLRGGLGTATALTGAAFGALSGSSVAAAATLAAVSVPAMRNNGYQPRFAAGIAATSGGLAMLIPPSIVIIVYGILTETDIGRLLIAGIIPGLILAIAIILVVQLTAVFKPQLIQEKEQEISWKIRIDSLKVIWPFVLLVGLVTGAIYAGIATPVEASALGAFGAMMLCILTGRLSWPTLREAVWKSLMSTAMISFILVGAGIFGLFVTLSGIAPRLLELIGQSGLNPVMIVILIAVAYLIMGLFLDTITILVLTLPVVQPIIAQLGFDMVWFGIIAILLVEIGLITPPLGLNLFIVSKVTDLSVAETFRGVTPFILVQLLVVILLIIFPSIVLWLPMRMT